GRAAANVGCIANRLRHDSSLASELAMNSSNGIGRFFVHNPPGERKSGMPHSVEMPAPVKGTMVDAAAIMSPSCSTPLRRSDAITGTIRKVQAVATIARRFGLPPHRPIRAGSGIGAERPNQEAGHRYAAFAIGSLASSPDLLSLFFAFAIGAAAADFRAGLPYCESFSSSASSSA